MAERTLSIVIEVDGAEDAVAQVRRMRSALDDLGGGAEGLRSVLRQSREVTQVMREMGKAFDLRQRQREMIGDLEDFFRRVTSGARSAGDVFKNIWREVADYFRRVVREIDSAWAGIGSVLGGLTVGSSNRALSALGGLGSGALVGFSVGGPIGAVVGGLIGGIAGLFGGGGGKQKRHDAEIANQGFAQLRQILDDYNHFRRDFASSVDAANRIWSQMQSQWARPQSAPSQRPFFDAILRSLEATEDERNRRRQLMALLPVPEFQEGGLVLPRRSWTGGTLALLHPGEFVMSQTAVDRWGVSLLDSLNRGSEPRPAGGDGGLMVEIAPAGREWFVKALEEGIPIVVRRGGNASKILRN